VRGNCGLPACLLAYQPPRNEGVLERAHSPPASGSSIGGSSTLSRVFPLPSPGRSKGKGKGEIARPCFECRLDRECGALSFPGDIATRALLPFVFVHRQAQRNYDRLLAFDALQRVSASW